MCWRPGGGGLIRQLISSDRECRVGTPKTLLRPTETLSRVHLALLPATERRPSPHPPTPTPSTLQPFTVSVPSRAFTKVSRTYSKHSVFPNPSTSRRAGPGWKLTRNPGASRCRRGNRQAPYRPPGHRTRAQGPSPPRRMRHIATQLAQRPLRSSSWEFLARVYWFPSCSFPAIE